MKNNDVQKQLEKVKINIYNILAILIVIIPEFFAEEYHQQYLAKPGSRPYCSAMPTKVKFIDFTGSNFKLNKKIWSYYDWNISHCILRGDNKPIQLNS